MQHRTSLGVLIDTPVLAEDSRAPSVARHGDAIEASVARLWYCKPEFDHKHESVDHWLARGGKIIRC